MKRIDRFLKFEVDNDLLKKKIWNIEYWAIVREMIFNEINQNFENIHHAHENFNNKNLSGKLKDITIFIYNAMKYKIMPLESRDILIFNHPRRLKNGLYYECLYTDEILGKIEHSHYVFEESSFNNHLQPVKTKEIRYTDTINFRFYIEYFYVKFSNRYKLDDLDRNHILNIIEMINNEFGVNFNKKLYVDKIQNELIKFKLLYKYYTKIISIIKPKLIIEVISYERRRKVINSIAKEYDIPTIELQHGTIGKYEIAYNYLKKNEIHTFPDYLLLFGDYWKYNSRYPISIDNVISVGWPYFEKRIKENDGNFYEENKKNILFISQGTIGVELSKYAIELTECLNNASYNIVYKLHPGEYSRWKTDYPWLVNSNVMVIDTSEFDMHYYFSRASIQIGVYSTSLFEGLGYGLKTIIFKLYGHEFMEDLYLNNYAKLVENVIDALRIIDVEEIDTLNIDTTYFWKPNSITNTICTIDRILKKSD